jgi:chemosensory pili system protein ChpA (sensor histidine kinase/response regulator)
MGVYAAQSSLYGLALGYQETTMQPEQQQQFIEDFGERAKDHLCTIERCLLNLQKAEDIELLYQILRAVHSINEGAGMVGLSSISQTAYRFQTCLETLRDYQIKFDQKIESLFLQVVDAWYLLVNKLEEPFGLTENEVNNAIAHGIELPEVRQAAGKSPIGQIALCAFHQGNQIVISFTDDGAGIDVERVKAKAIEKGLIKSDEAQSLSTIQVYELLYCPDFSTKNERDLRAGLGFGLDVIRTELTKIGGVISTNSTLGKETTFTIVYPEKIS